MESRWSLPGAKGYEPRLRIEPVLPSRGCLAGRGRLGLLCRLRLKWVGKTRGVGPQEPLVASAAVAASTSAPSG
jgi:hypothetical protein